MKTMPFSSTSTTPPPQFSHQQHHNNNKTSPPPTPTTTTAAATVAAVSLNAACPHAPTAHAHFTSPLFQAAVKAGLPGAAAAAAQSASFMWISTAAAFQYRSGVTMTDAFRTLYAQGGLPRFYSGMIPTVLHVTLCRFGDTTANVLALSHTPTTLTTNIFTKTFLGSLLAASWRVLLLPLETIRSNLQVKGQISGKLTLLNRINNVGIFKALYSGGSASFTAGLLGHFPFFCTVNVLSERVVDPLDDHGSVWKRVGRNGGMGFLAAMCSDVVTNGFKIIATNKQTSKSNVSYYETARKIIKRDGALALVTRGLKTRLLGNGLQGAFFVLLWKEIESRRASTHTTIP